MWCAYRARLHPRLRLAVSILRQRAEYLGTVQAADQRAGKAALAAFELDDDRRKRLAVREE